MSVPLSNTKLRVPNGFPDILEAFTREILRTQPKDIFAFGVSYFERLLPTRENIKSEPSSKVENPEDRFYNNDAFKEEDVDPSNPQQQSAALSIQTKYRQHAAKKEVKNKREEKAAIKIQAGARGYMERQKMREKKNLMEGTSNGEIAERLTPKQEPSAGGEGKDEGRDELDIDLNDPDVEKAAVKIQAGFKGFKTRKELTSNKQSEENEKPETTAPKEDTGATVAETDVKTDDKEESESDPNKQEDCHAGQEPETDATPEEEEKKDLDTEVPKQEDTTSAPETETGAETKTEISSQLEENKDPVLEEPKQESNDVVEDNATEG